ncbi:MAG: hypothetical protein HY885_13710 [Deltaproteobacteria bacterium]|nr:hypothetical protein [Deltaproteobacteria bacterium]
MAAEIFKKCTACSAIWPLQADFLADPSLSLLGYQVSFKELETGFFLFSHACRNTIGLRVKQFQNLYDGVIFTEKLTGSRECPGYCLNMKELKRCPSHCECAYVREIMQIIMSWPKDGDSPVI